MSRLTVRRAVAVLGVVAVAGAVLALAVPALGDRVGAALGGLSPDVVVALLVLAAALVALVRSHRSYRIGSLAAGRIGPSRTTVGQAPELGAEFERLLDRATDPDRTRARRREAREQVCERLRTTAVVALAPDLGRTGAEGAVERGEWTDDPRAAALVGGDAAPSPPWYLWLWDLLRGEDAFRRRVRHAVCELEEVAS